MSERQTIFALSSGKLPAGIAVVRLSGPNTRAVVEHLAGCLPVPRRAELRNITTTDNRLLDTALVLWFPHPASFTGEDCAEFHCHGGPAVITALFSEIGKLEGCRLADAGEFSLRAFVNGKADLTQMEALADLLDAETESQRAFAIAAATGSQKLLYENWRADLLDARAFLEADLDFSDEDDVPGSVATAANRIVQRLVVAIAEHLKSAAVGEIIRDGFHVVIAGAANAGKSTLLNALAKRDVAIVTDIAGTTRDVLDVSLDLNGVKIVISDTAGLRGTSDRVELIGIERAYAAIDRADLVLMLSEDVVGTSNISSSVWQVRTKVDLLVECPEGFDFCISCQTGLGVDALVNAIGSAARNALGNWNEGEVVRRARHAGLLSNALDALTRFEMSQRIGMEFAADELRVAAESLGRITGIIDSEDVLGAIFSSFCIGK